MDHNKARGNTRPPKCHPQLQAPNCNSATARQASRDIRPGTRRSLKGSLVKGAPKPCIVSLTPPHSNPGARSCWIGPGLIRGRTRKVRAPDGLLVSRAYALRILTSTWPTPTSKRILGSCEGAPAPTSEYTRFQATHEESNSIWFSCRTRSTKKRGAHKLGPQPDLNAVPTPPFCSKLSRRHSSTHRGPARSRPSRISQNQARSPGKPGTLSTLSLSASPYTARQNVGYPTSESGATNAPNRLKPYATLCDIISP